MHLSLLMLSLISILSTGNKRALTYIEGRRNDFLLSFVGIERSYLLHLSTSPHALLFLFLIPVSLDIQFLYTTQVPNLWPAKSSLSQSLLWRFPSLFSSGLLIWNTIYIYQDNSHTFLLHTLDSHIQLLTQHQLDAGLLSKHFIFIISKILLTHSISSHHWWHSILLDHQAKP